jgi:hypothetical protein
VEALAKLAKKKVQSNLGMHSRFLLFHKPGNKKVLAHHLRTKKQKKFYGQISKFEGKKDQETKRHF